MIGIKELGDLLKTIQIGGTEQDPIYIEVWYDHFVSTPRKPNLVPPFILYCVEDTSTLKADDKVHYQENNYIVDFVCDVKNVLIEQQIETLFNNNYLPYDKEETYIGNERIFQVRYFI